MDVPDPEPTALRTHVAGVRTDLVETRAEFRAGWSELESTLVKSQRAHLLAVLGSNTVVGVMAMAFVTFG